MVIPVQDLFQSEQSTSTGTNVLYIFFRLLHLSSIRNRDIYGQRIIIVIICYVSYPPLIILIRIDRKKTIDHLAACHVVY